LLGHLRLHRPYDRAELVGRLLDSDDERMMSTPAASDHWRFPGWWSLAVAGAIGLLTPPLAAGISWAVKIDRRDLALNKPLILLALITLPIFVFVEEWLFRGVALRLLEKPLGAVAAVVISSALFSLAHGNLANAPARFAVGVVLGVIYLKTRSLWASIATHAVHDLLLFSIMLWQIR
jgi:membrane protease YdiL (CAAX protease family)